MAAADIAAALGGSPCGDAWTARCPAHGDRNPSLSIRDGADGRVLVRCHAGCDQARVIAALRKLGLWNQHPPSIGNLGEARPVLVSGHPRGEIERSELALRIWGETAPARGTLVEAYLYERGLTRFIPTELRFHPAMKHRSNSRWPAMVALVRAGIDGRPIAIHRTFLARDGRGKAPVEPQKMMLGPCRGGAVRLALVTDRLMVGEGIETCLAAMQAMGQPAWAALSTSGLRTLDLPAVIREVTVLADGDDAGEAAARVTAQRWAREGRRVRIARPPRGMDFNDLLLGRVPEGEDGAA